MTGFSFFECTIPLRKIFRLGLVYFTKFHSCVKWRAPIMSESSCSNTSVIRVHVCSQSYQTTAQTSCGFGQTFDTLQFEMHWYDSQSAGWGSHDLHWLCRLAVWSRADAPAKRQTDEMRSGVSRDCLKNYSEQPAVSESWSVLLLDSNETNLPFYNKNGYDQPRKTLHDSLVRL